MKIKLVFASLMIIGMLQASENKNLEFIGLGSIEMALVQWNINKNDCPAPIIYQGSYLFKDTYKFMKSLNDCVLVFDNNDIIIHIDKVKIQSPDKASLQNNNNSAVAQDILEIINKKNKNKILPVSFIPMEGRSIIFHIKTFNNNVMKKSYFDEIKKLLDHKKTKIFVVVDSDCNVDEIKQLFLAKSMPFIFYQKK